MTRSCRAEFRHRGGFTLVEMMVAVAVSALIVLTLAAIASTSLKSASSNNNSLLALSSANAALDLIVNDLRSVAATPQPSPTGTGSYEFLQVRPDPNTGNLNGTTPALLMLNAASAQDSISNSSDPGLQPRAICYQIAYQDPINPSNANASAKVYGLYRTVLNSATTFTTFLGQTGLFGGLWQTRSATLPPASAFIVGNVVDFQLVFYACRISGSGQLLTTPVPIYSSSNPASSGNPIHLTSSGWVIQNNNTVNLDFAYNHGPVVCTDVTIVVLDNNGAAQLNAGAIPLATAKLRYGHSLTRRVTLPEPF